MASKEDLAIKRALAAEKRRAEKEAREAEAEKFRIEQNRLKLEPLTIKEFEDLNVKLRTFYNEISLLSKKSPDGPINKFKLKFINETLKNINEILGETHRPFPDFEIFSEDDFPTASDVVLMFSHYLKSMEFFKFTHTYRIEGRGLCWRTKNGPAIKA